MYRRTKAKPRSFSLPEDLLRSPGIPRFISHFVHLVLTDEMLQEVTPLQKRKLGVEVEEA